MLPPRLVAKNPIGRKSREFRLSNAEITVGSEKGNLLLLPVESVSRRHAVLRPQNGSFAVYDLKSTNGTFVNDQRIESSAVLNDRDYIRFGKVEFVFLDPDSDRRKRRNQSPGGPLLLVMVAAMVAAGFGITEYVFNHQLVDDAVAHLLRTL